MHKYVASRRLADMGLVMRRYLSRMKLSVRHQGKLCDLPCEISQPGYRSQSQKAMFDLPGFELR